MNPRAKKSALLLLAAAMLIGAGLLQIGLNRERDALGLTISPPLQDAPPVLALTTQALGGFRGLISNFLWMRSNNLRLNDQYFEAVQLADWITDLEPHFTMVWTYEGWDMAYNISVKFTDPSDRWRWVKSGIELLRDRGLRYNPDDPLIYRELGWFYQHKMGQNLDDANNYYKQAWAQEMTPFFGPNGTNFDDLIHPQTAAERTNAFVLAHQYKIDARFAQRVNTEWGPLDWRLPEAHAIYWASLGLLQAREHPEKVKEDLLIQLRRVVYQSMQQAFHHGRIIANPFNHTAELAPNLAIIPKVNETYETEMREDTNYAAHISIAHRNFLRNAVYYLYEDNRIADAQKWYHYLGQLYPTKPILDNVPDSFPGNLTLDDYAVACVQQNIRETSQDDMTAAVMGLLSTAYGNLAIGQDDRYAGLSRIAKKSYDIYQAKISKYAKDQQRVGLDPFPTLNHRVLDDLLNPKTGLPFDARAVICSQLGIAMQTNAPSAATPRNSAAPAISSTPTNAPATNSAAQ